MEVVGKEEMALYNLHYTYLSTTPLTNQLLCVTAPTLAGSVSVCLLIPIPRMFVVVVVKSISSDAIYRAIIVCF